MNFEKRVERWVDYLHDHNALFNKLINWLRESGISRSVRKYWVYQGLKKDAKVPTAEMNEAREYFKKNKEILKANLALLEDEESKAVYKKIVQFRYTHDTKKFPKYSLEDQYFPKDIITLGENEVFIDCGAYQGDTYEVLRRETDDGFRGVVCFEPAEENYAILKEKAKNDSRVTVVKAGVWNENTTLYFNSDVGKTAKVVENEISEFKIDVKAIDCIEECKDATYIKMDVEGSEMQALKGAEQTIRKNRPKLAISIYHSNEDLVQIIQWVANLDMNYKLYVRQHDFVDVDTVLYAI